MDSTAVPVKCANCGREIMPHELRFTTPLGHYLICRDCFMSYFARDRWTISDGGCSDRIAELEAEITRLREMLVQAEASTDLKTIRVQYSVADGKPHLIIEAVFSLAAKEDVMLNLPWGKYLVRRDGQLAVAEHPPVCECCNGNGICPICDSTGLGWHWRIKPTRGMLIADRDGDWTCYRGAPSNLYPTFDYETEVRHSFTPLLPPAALPGVTPTELLGLLECGRFTHRIEQAPGLSIAYQLHHPDKPFALLIHRPCIGRTAWFDTAPLKLAIQHHEALQEWLAAAKEAV